MFYKILVLFLFFVATLSSAEDSSIYKLCDAIENSNDHKKGVTTIQETLKKTTLSNPEKVKLNSLLINKLLQIQQFDQCLKIAEEQVLIARKGKNYYDEAKFYNHIGNTFYYLSNLKIANSYYLKGAAIADKYDYIDLIELFNHNLGAISMENGGSDIATEKYFLKSIEYSKKNIHVKQDFAMGHYRILASLYWRQKKYNKAEQIFKRLIIENQAAKNTYQEAAAKIFYSKLLMDLHRQKEALAMSYSAVQLSKTFNSVDILSTAYSAHSQNLKAANMSDSAYHYIYELQNLVRNNYQEGLNKQIAEAEAKFNTVEIEHEKDMAILDAKRKNQFYLFASLGVVMATIFGFILYSNRLKTRQEKEHVQAMLLAEENERSRIARDLHDGIGQLLSAAKLNLHALENSKSENKDKILQKAIGLLDESAKEVRSVSHNMMPNALLKSGLVSAIKNFIDQLQSDTLKINIETSGLHRAINSSIENVVYRVIQESINNVIKHANANQLFINLSIENNLLNVMIEDNGRGFDMEKMKENEGIGIKNMRARIAFLKGTMEIDSKPKRGTLIAFHIPLNNDNGY